MRARADEPAHPAPKPAPAPTPAAPTIPAPPVIAPLSPDPKQEALNTYLSRRTTGLLVAGLGVAGAAAGTAIILAAKPDPPPPSVAGLPPQRHPLHPGQVVGAALIGGGLIALGVGAALALGLKPTTPTSIAAVVSKKPKPGWKVMPTYSRGPGVSFQGRF
jgi:hypothetical protein